MNKTIFGRYASYYNLLYKNKDYAGEAAYVNKHIQRHYPGARTVLSLGCGTGNHDFELAKFGYEITGIDMSEEMLTSANSCLSSLPHLSSTGSCSFHRGDIRSIRLNQTFDVVISLFHVMSYQTTNSDLEAAFETASAHLHSEGIFLFDFWYGPSVLTQKPEVRVKRMEDNDIRIVRIAEPVMHVNENVVDVNYTVFIEEKKTGEVEQMRETHNMRYLFLPEIDNVLKGCGFQLKESHAWMTDYSLACDHWAGIVVATNDRMQQP